MLPNIEAPTLGGKHTWRDVYLHAGWRIQENLWTGHFRLLDPENTRHAWGSYAETRAYFNALCTHDGITPPSSDLVVLLHGILPVIHPFEDMLSALRAENFDAAMVSYPSTLDTIEAHAHGVARLLNRLHGTQTVSFVTHSMGGLVLRHLLALKAPWRRRIDVRKVVMIAPPNRGAAMARLLEDFPPFEWIYGVAGQQLTPESVDAVPGIDVPFIIVSGGKSDSSGYNPLLDGDDDGTVRVEETHLNGVEAMHVVRDLHTAIGDNAETIRITLDYLSAGTHAGKGLPPQ